MIYRYRDTEALNINPISKTGSIVEIDNPDELLAVKSLSVELEPIQDLNGYDKPWAGGSGDNKYPNSAISGTANGVTVTQSGSDYILSGTASAYAQIVSTETFILKAGSYVLKEFNWARGVGLQLRSTDGQTVYASASYSESVTFTLSEDTECKARIVVTANTVTDMTIKAMVVSGSTAPTTYSPYENVCPISGRTECDTYVGGVNVWDEEWELGGFNADGSKSSVQDCIRSKNYIPCVGNASYYIKQGTLSDTAWSYFVFYDESKSVIGSRVAVYGTFTTPSNARYMKFNTNNSYGATYHDDISINYPSTDTDYHAYEGNQYTTTLGRTVYGGTLDVVSGVLTIDKVTVTLDGSESWHTQTAGGSIFYTDKHDLFKSDNYVGKIYCDKLETAPRHFGIPFGSITAYYDANSQYAGQNWIYVRIDSAITSVPALKPWLQSNPLQVVYELATPQTYQLTGQDVELIEGTNYVWSDGGNTTLEYYTDLSRFTGLPSEAVSMNGRYLENIVEGYRTLYVAGRESLATDLNTYSVGTADGERLKNRRYPARTLTVGFQLTAGTNEEFRQRFNQLNNILSIEQADFIFADEPDKFFTGYPIMDADVEAGRNNVVGEFHIYCAYPFKRSVNTITLSSDDEGVVVDDNSATFTFDYNGVIPAKPLLRAIFAEANASGVYTDDGDCGYVAFANQDESVIQLGNPEVMDIDPVDKNTTLVNKVFTNFIGWTNNGMNIVIISDEHWHHGRGQANKYASGVGTLSRSVTNAVDFEFDIVHRLCTLGTGQTGSFKCLLQNADDTVVGFTIEKTGSGTTATVSYILDGRVVGADVVDISQFNSSFGFCNSQPAYVTTGSYERMYAVNLTRMDRNGKTYTVRAVKENKTYTQSNLNSGISRDGEVVTFSVGELPDRTFKASSIAGVAINKVTFEITGDLYVNAIGRCALVQKAGVSFADIPNVFTAGDIVEADCNDATVALYREGSAIGHIEPMYGALGNDWEDFEIKVGTNVIKAVWSDWVNTNYKPTIEIEFNEVYI